MHRICLKRIKDTGTKRLVGLFFYNSILHNGGSEGKGKQKLRKVVKTCSAYIAESASYYSA